MQVLGKRVVVIVDELKVWGHLHVPQGIGQGMGIVKYAGTECTMVKRGDRILMPQGKLIPWVGKWDYYSNNAGKDMLLWENDILAIIHNDNLIPINNRKLFFNVCKFVELEIYLASDKIQIPSIAFDTTEVVRDFDYNLFLVDSSEGFYVTHNNIEYRLIDPLKLLATISGVSKDEIDRISKK